MVCAIQGKCKFSQTETLHDADHSTDSILAESSSDDDEPFQLDRHQHTLGEHIQAHLLSPDRCSSNEAHVTLRGSTSGALAATAPTAAAAMQTPNRGTQGGIPDSAGSVMSNRGLHLLGSPMLSPFAAMPQLYSTPQRTGGGCCASPGPSPIPSATDASPAGMLHTAMGCPLTPASPPASRAEQRAAPPSPPPSAPLARRSRVLSPPLHPALHAMHVSPVIHAGDSLATLHSIGGTPSPPLPQGGGGAADASHTSDTVSMALDFSESTDSMTSAVFAGGGSASLGAAAAAGLHAGASPVMDPVTGQFLGYFIASPHLDLGGTGALVPPSGVSAPLVSSGVEPPSHHLSSLLPLAELPTGSAHASGLSMDSFAVSDSSSVGISQGRSHSSQEPSRKGSGSPPSTPHRKSCRQPPGAWMTHYLGSFDSTRTSSNTARRCTLRSSPSSSPAAWTSPVNESSSPLQRRQLRSKWWIASMSQPTLSMSKSTSNTPPGQQWSDSIRTSAHRIPLQLTAGGTSSRHHRWQAASRVSPSNDRLIPARLHPSYSFGGAMQEGKAYGLSQGDSCEYAAAVAGIARSRPRTADGALLEMYSSSRIGDNSREQFDLSAHKHLVFASPIARHPDSSSLPQLSVEYGSTPNAGEDSFNV